MYERIKSYSKLEEKYREYAEETYTVKFGGDRVAELAETILADAGYTRAYNKLNKFTGFKDQSGNAVPDHEVILTVIEYLRNGYEYRQSRRDGACQGGRP